MLNLKNRLKYILRQTLILFMISGFFVLIHCKKNNTGEISKIPVDLEILRFDREFATANPTQLPTLQLRYPYLFPKHYPDSIWRAKLTDTLQIALSEAVDSTFNAFDKETQALKSLFQHILYYFPKIKVPKVITLTSDIRYNDRVVLTDTLLLLGLDNYLGKDHRFYQGIPRYIAAELDKQYLIADVAGAFAEKIVPYPTERSFLARMLYYGKILYLKDQWLPSLTDAQKIGYTQRELEWTQANETQIWRYFVEREVVYSTDAKLDRRFLNPAPFSRFGLELDNNSPGKLGRYIGWQIVRTFMKKNTGDLQQLLALPATEIFKQANYKPKK